MTTYKIVVKFDTGRFMTSESGRLTRQLFKGCGIGWLRVPNAYIYTVGEKTGSAAVVNDTIIANPILYKQLVL